MKKMKNIRSIKRRGQWLYLKKQLLPVYSKRFRELYQGGAPMSSQIARKVVAAFNTNPPASVAMKHWMNYPTVKKKYWSNYQKD